MAPVSRAGRQFAVLAGLLVAASLAAADTPYALTNPSFESPTLSPSNSWFAGVDGWGSSGSPGTTYVVAGVPTPTNGNQEVYGALDSFMVWQQTGTMAAHTYYEFKIDIYPLTTGTNRAGLIFEETDTWSTPMVQMHYHPSWNPTQEDFVLVPGQWNTITARFNSSTFPALVGKNFRIRIEGAHVALDNARMITSTDRDYYVSFSSGSDTNDGLTSTTPWKTFTNVNARVLGAGDRVLLKRGDTWNQELNIKGRGASGNNIHVTAYGSGNRPIISRTDLAYDKCLVAEAPSFLTIDNLDLRNAKLGIYLRYINTAGHQSVTITDCNLRDMNDPTLSPELHNYEFAFSNGIHMGGKVWGDTEFATVLDGLTIQRCVAERVAHGFGTGWYYPAPYRSRLRNLVMEDNLAVDCIMGWATIMYTDGGHMKRCHSIDGGGVNTWCGSTAGMIQSSQNYLIDDCEIGYMNRLQAGDGCGFDFEGDTHNVTFTNNTIHHCDASALLILSTGGPHTNLNISNNTFYANAQDPWNSEINSEIQGSQAAHSGCTIANNGIYRRSSSINFLSPSSNWSGFAISGNRQLEYASVRGVEQPWYEFQTVGWLEGWNTFNQWTSNTVSSGVLWGASTGVDPYGHTPGTFINTTQLPYVWVRMSQTAGTHAQIFYITDTDPAWDGAKSVTFPITADGVQRDYFVNLDGASHKGVITKVRLDPTIVSGSNMAIDHVRITGSTDPGQSAPPPVPADPYTLVFQSLGTEDGNILESAANSGTGGTVDATGTTFRLGDDASNRAWRQFLSFDTSAIPDDATIVEATIGMTRTGTVGSIPIGVANSSYGDLNVDVVTGNFSGASALAAGDYNAAATKNTASLFAWPAYMDGMTTYSRLELADNGLIKKTGRTQYRVRYQNDDDADATADAVIYATGDHATVASRPSLTIKYTVPAGSYWPLLADDFEGGWGNYIDGGADCALHTTTTNALQGKASLNLQDNSGAASAAASKVLDLHNPGFTSLRVDFIFKGVSMENGEDFFVEYFNGSAWVVVGTWVAGTHFTNGTWTTAQVTVNESSQAFPVNAQVRLRCDASDDNDDVYIDSLVVSVK